MPDDWMGAFNKVLNEAFADLMPKSPNYRYYAMTKAEERRCGVRWSRRFAYTTEQTRGQKNAATGFYAIEYRLRPATPAEKKRNPNLIGMWEIVREVRFGRRKVAKARALAWFKEFEARAKARVAPAAAPQEGQP